MSSDAILTVCNLDACRAGFLDNDVREIVTIYGKYGKVNMTCSVKMLLVKSFLYSFLVSCMRPRKSSQRCMFKSVNALVEGKCLNAEVLI